MTWIPTAERFPEAYTRVIIWSPKLKYMEMGYVDADNKVNLLNIPGHYLTDNTVFWMDLPDPPEQRILRNESDK